MQRDWWRLGGSQNAPELLRQAAQLSARLCWQADTHSGGRRDWPWSAVLTFCIEFVFFCVCDCALLSFSLRSQGHGSVQSGRQPLDGSVNSSGRLTETRGAEVDPPPLPSPIRSARPLIRFVSLCVHMSLSLSSATFPPSDNITTLVSAYRDMRPEMEEAAVSWTQGQAAAGAGGRRGRQLRNARTIFARQCGAGDEGPGASIRDTERVCILTDARFSSVLPFTALLCSSVQILENFGLPKSIDHIA